MKAVIVALLALCAMALWIIVMDMQWDSASTVGVLEIASLVVSVSVVSSVIFGVITYLESSVLREQVKGLSAELTSIRKESERELQQLATAHRERHYDLAMLSLRAMFEAAMSLPSSSSVNYVGTITQIKTAEIEIHLSHGTQVSLFKAIEEVYKQGYSRFLEIEMRVWEASSSLVQEDQVKIRLQYMKLKQRVLREVKNSESTQAS